jgi:hypothetical protein
VEEEEADAAEEDEGEEVDEEEALDEMLWTESLPDA